MLSIRGTDFIACWAYEARISAHAQPGVKCEQFYMYNPCWAYGERIFFQVSRAFGIPQKNWSRFDLFIDVYSILFYCISSYTLYFIYCIFTCCWVLHAVLLLLLWGFVFTFNFCHYFSVSVVCFLQLCVSGVSSADHVLSKIVRLGRRASVSHVLRCWFCCSLYYFVFISLTLCR